MVDFYDKNFLSITFYDLGAHFINMDWIQSQYG